MGAPLVRLDPPEVYMGQFEASNPISSRGTFALQFKLTIAMDLLDLTADPASRGRFGLCGL